MTQNAKGPAATAIAPDRGSANPTKDQEMNAHSDNMACSLEASTVPTLVEVFKELEAISNAIQDLQRKSYLLMGDLDDTLRSSRGKVDAVGIHLIFQARGIDVTNWLAGEVWTDAVKIEEQTEALIGRLEGVMA